MSYVDNPQPIYEIVIEGQLDPSWQQWISGLVVMPTHTSRQFPTSTLIGPVADQAALRGILCKLWDLNLNLISVRRIMAVDEEEKAGD